MAVLKFKALFTLGLWASGLLSAYATPDLSEYETEDDYRVPIPRSVVSTHADTFSAHVTAAYPLIQSWIDHPNASSAAAVNDAIQKVIPEADTIVSSLGGDTGRECSGPHKKRGSNRNTVTTFPDAVRCIGEGLQDISSAIEQEDAASKVNEVISQLDDLKPEVEDLKNTQNKLESRADKNKPASKKVICNQKCGPCKANDLDAELSDFEDESDLCSRSLDEDDTEADIAEHDKRELSEEGNNTEESDEVDTHGLEEEDGDENASQDVTKRGLKVPANPKQSFAPWYLKQFKDSYNVPHGMPAAAITKAFHDKQVKMGVVNLYGCTSVIIASKYGAYVSHFWEGPSFISPGANDHWAFNQEKFNHDVINTLGNGCHWTENDGFQGDYFFPAKVDSICLPGFHADDADTQVVIVTPWLPGETNIKYPNQVSQIKKHIKQLLPNAAEPRVEGYFNIGQSDSLIKNERFVDNGKFTFGKVLLNFEPASKTKMHSVDNVELQSELEIWIGDRVKPAFTHTWPATEAHMGCE